MLARGTFRLRSVQGFCTHADNFVYTTTTAKVAGYDTLGLPTLWNTFQKLYEQ